MVFYIHKSLAFLVGILVWFFLVKRNPYEYSNYSIIPKNQKFWIVLQWISTSALWLSWLYQDVANIAVYIPRKLSLIELICSIGIIGIALSFTLWNNGGKIQKIVSDKTDINYPKAATLIDLNFTLILFFFGYVSKMPMSTTWVFLGLITGREIVLHLITKRDEPYLDTFQKLAKDAMLALFGLIISIGIVLLSIKLK